MKYLKIGLGGILVIGAIMLYQSGLLTVDAITSLVQDNPQIAPMIFVGLYIVATLLFLPATPLSLAAGALFGALWGSVYILIGATVGATLAFFVSRFLLQDWAHKIVTEKMPRLGEYSEAMRKNGFVTVLFFRLVPLFPFNGLNFALGITQVRFGEYLGATVLGMIPGVITLSFLGGAFISGNVRDIVIGGGMYLVLASVGIIYNQYKKKLL